MRPARKFAALLASGSLLCAAGATTAAAADAVLRNADFEAGLTNWQVTGTRAASTVEAGVLTHRSSGRFAVSTSQRVSGLSHGWWTFAAWIRTGGRIGSTTINLQGCGSPRYAVAPVTAQDQAYVRVAVSTLVTGSRCTVRLSTSGGAGDWATFDRLTLSPGQVTRAIRGADLSGLAKNEDYGAVYRTADGRRGDAVQILDDAGANLGRLKVWVNPADGYNAILQVVATARRLQRAHQKLLIDFHYSDRWTDPGSQTMPAAWKGLTAPQVATKVYEHTHQVLAALKSAGITADYFQVGNEINPGMLWPLGQTWDVDPNDDVVGAQWDNLASFLKAGQRAAKDIDPRTKVLLHLTNINNGVDSLTWWFDNVVSRGVPFDLIGLSYYGYWHGSLADLQTAVSTLSARYDRDVLVVETAYPFTLADDPATLYPNIIDEEAELVPGYPATPQGQAAAFRAVQDAVAAAPGGRGIGTVYWEPAWTAVPGSGWDPADPTSGNAWENQALFDFHDRLLPAAHAFAPDPPR
ncbi:glycosyl hydrolase 53 family protein [Kribbella albertanoniae]|uniref:Arabinogalactan endo-beta-1,4-galactanase n=1 Tax=Kribbella albertanoniae TaxID=1266829 RepID=A0A4R4PNV2_9ACTN|nr:glycosyl hydrolase 53 family protein [Kribbella albertanoniae]TDC23733.1 arabinogalactan endo-1,4-beta-galactosidase [Kribbella albertanoniae]